MKLMHGKLSPFVRKVMVAAHEKGMASDIEIVPTAVGAGKINRDLLALNPTGKIPTLVTDAVIVDYLDELRPTPRLIPAEGAARRPATSRRCCRASGSSARPSRCAPSPTAGSR